MEKILSVSRHVEVATHILDTMDRLPSFAPYPPAKLRLSIAPDEWEKCLDAWIFLAESHLRPPQTHFQSLSLQDGRSIAEFVTSYVHELNESSDTVPKSNPKAATLYKLVFMLYRALLSADQISGDILKWDTLANFVKAFQHISEAKSVLDHLWTKHTAQCEESFLGIKKRLIQQIESSEPSSWIPEVLKLLPLLHLSPQTAAFFAIGSDLIDGFANAFPQVSQSGDQQTVTIFIYLILLSLVQVPKRNISVLSDHLYTLKVDAKQRRGHSHPSLLESLVSNTPIIKRLKAMSEHSDSDSFEAMDIRRDITAGLLEFQSKRTWPKKQKASKSVAAANEAVEAVHIHQMSLITQVQDLFPDLGSAFVAKLLDEYSENVEQVIAHLLDDSLPDYLATADRTEQLQAPVGHQQPAQSHLAPRRNVHDGDALDTLAVSASQLRLSKGRADPTSREHALLPSAANKAAILAALARFDADDDERDDTYDAADVGGSVDARPDDPALGPRRPLPGARRRGRARALACVEARRRGGVRAGHGHAPGRGAGAAQAGERVRGRGGRGVGRDAAARAGARARAGAAVRGRGVARGAGGAAAHGVAGRARGRGGRG